MNKQGLIFFVALALFVAALAVYQTTLPPVMKGSAIDPPAPMPDFTLQAADGPVTLSQFTGKYVILYFGFTNCPDVCPTTLANLRDSLERLGADAEQFQVIFVSVDPARDTPELASAYAARFHPTFLGLSGTQEQVDVVTKGYGIFVQLNDPDPESGYYSVDHTATTLVLNREGALALTWPYGLSPDDLLEDMKALVRR